MSVAGQRILAAAREALAIATGRSSPARVTGYTAKGRKVVAKDFLVEYRQIFDQWGHALFIEKRTVFWELHPTKGWRRAGSTAWTRWEADQQATGGVEAIRRGYGVGIRRRTNRHVND